MVVAKAPRKSYAATQWLQCVLLLLGDIADGLTPKLAMTSSSQCNIKLFPGTFLSLLFGNTIINYLDCLQAFSFFSFKGLEKDEKPPPPPPAPTPRKPSQEEELQAVIITLEGLNAFQVLSRVPQNYVI